MSASEAPQNTPEPLPVSVYAYLMADLPAGRSEDHVCRMVGCEVNFSPKRINQRFCGKVEFEGQVGRVRPPRSGESQ